MTDLSKRFVRPSRREFIGASAGAVFLASGRSARAQSAKTIKIGFISPVSGPLAAFGQGDAFVLKQVRTVLSKGYKIGGTDYTVEILDRDTQSDPSRSAQLAKELITSAGVDLILASSTPETINPVADACEASGVPCISTVMPWQAWYFGRGAKPGQPSPFKWSYHFGFGVDEFAKCYISQWNLIPTNKKVGVLYPNDADGNAVRSFLAPQSSIRAASKTSRSTIPRRSALSRRLASRSSTLSLSLRTLPLSGIKPPNNGSRAKSRSRRSPRPVCFPRISRPWDPWVPICRAPPTGTRTCPTSHP